MHSGDVIARHGMRWTEPAMHEIKHFLCSFCICPISRLIHHSVYIAWFRTLDTVTCRQTCHVQSLLKYRVDTLDTLDTLILKTLPYIEIMYVKSCYISHISNTHNSIKMTSNALEIQRTYLCIQKQRQERMKRTHPYFDPFKTHMRCTQTARTVTHVQTKHEAYVKTQPR